MESKADFILINVALTTQTVHCCSTRELQCCNNMFINFAINLKIYNFLSSEAINLITVRTLNQKILTKCLIIQLKYCYLTLSLENDQQNKNKFPLLFIKHFYLTKSKKFPECELFWNSSWKRRKQKNGQKFSINTKVICSFIDPKKKIIIYSF